MKTSELTGALLDYWVAKAERSDDATIEDWGSGVIWCISSHGAFERVPFQPSIKWAQGGPLLDKYKLCVGEDEGVWECRAPEVTYKSSLWAMRRETNGIESYGATALEAICRVVVGITFGDEVEDLP